MGRLINRDGGIISGGLVSGICNIFVSKEMDLDPREGLKPEGALTWDFTVPVCQNWSRIRTMCACCLCHVRPSVFYLNLGLFLPFFSAIHLSWSCFV